MNRQEHKQGISRIINKISTFIINRPKTVLMIIVILTALFGYSASKMQQDQSLDAFFSSEDPAKEFRDKFREQFGNDFFFVIAFTHENIFSEKVLTMIERITTGLEELEDVRDVVSLTNVEDIIGDEFDFIVEEFIEEIPGDAVALDSLYQAAITNPLFERLLISQDGKSAAIVVRTFNRPDDDSYKERVLTGAMKILNQEPEYQFHLAGETVFSVRMAQYTSNDLAFFMPITLLMMCALIFLIFRNFRLTLIATVNLGLCLIWTMGMFLPLDVTMNMTTSIITPLILALATAVVIHIFSWYYRQAVMQYVRDKDNGSSAKISHSAKLQIIRSTWRELLTPCFLTSLTTAFGFLSLLVNDVEVIKHLGKVAPCGMFITFFVSLTFIPAMLTFVPVPASFFRSRQNKVLDKAIGLLSRVVIKHAKPIIAGSIFLIILAGWSMLKVRVETNPREFFHEKTPVAQALDFMDEYLSGVGTIEISIRGSHEEAILEPASMAAIESITTYLEKMENIDKVVSPNMFLKEMNKSFHAEDAAYYRLPDSKNMAAQYMLLFSGDDIEDYLDQNYRWARISARTPAHSTKDLKIILDDTQNFLATNFADSPLDIRITGRTLLEVNLLKAYVDGQIQSILLAVVLIFGLMFFIFRSFSLGIVSFLPNAFPILANLGIMGLLDIPLNTATAIISTVAIGIAVDDTIHFLFHYRQEKLKGATTEQAIISSMQSKGIAIIGTTVVISLGFIVIVSSTFTPVRDFGFLTALTMVNALIGDLVILPAFLKIFKPVKQDVKKKVAEDSYLRKASELKKAALCEMR